MSVTIDEMITRYSFSNCLSPLFYSAIFDKSFDNSKLTKTRKMHLIFARHKIKYEKTYMGYLISYILFPLWL